MTSVNRRSMSDTLARSKMYSFETNERFEVIAPSGEKRVVHFTRKVSVRRPNALFFELHGKSDTALEVAAYYDGQTLTLSEKPDESTVWNRSSWERRSVDECSDR